MFFPMSRKKAKAGAITDTADFAALLTELIAGEPAEGLARVRSRRRIARPFGTAPPSRNPLPDFANPGSATPYRASRVYLRVGLPIGEGSPEEILP